jgi:hypothetical protein
MSDSQVDVDQMLAYDVLGVTVPARTMLADASLRDLADALKSVLADGADTPRKHQQ